jgi:hypothetical protein
VECLVDRRVYEIFMEIACYVTCLYISRTGISEASVINIARVWRRVLKNTKFEIEHLQVILNVYKHLT